MSKTAEGIILEALSHDVDKTAFTYGSWSMTIAEKLRESGHLCEWVTPIRQDYVPVTGDVVYLAQYRFINGSGKSFIGRVYFDEDNLWHLSNEKTVHVLQYTWFTKPPSHE